MYTLKNISHFAFFDSLEKDLASIESQLDSESLDSEEFLKQANQQIQKVEKTLKECLLPSADDILFILDKNYNDLFDHIYSEYGFDKEHPLKKEIKRLDRFRKSLKQVIAYLSVTESLFNTENKTVIETVIHKNDFILAKLNSLFSDETYSIERIFDFNGIKYRDGEGREIAEDLHRRGYVALEDRYGKLDYVKISVKGAAYIERKNKQRGSTKEKSELDKKLDNIIEHLTKLGYGQEIIFNEIDELRQLQYKLSKKSWSQLLKGKLVDLALDKLIDNETISAMYEYLTSSNFRLLK